MFDKIHFITNNLTLPVVNEHMIANLLEEYMADNNIEYQIDTANNTLPWEASFHLFGTCHVIMPSIISSFAEKSLFYIQSFSVFDMKSNFYTKRSDYSSYEVLYTYDGMGKLEYEGKIYNLTTGDGFFIDCRKPHYYETIGDNWKHCVFHFWGPLASNYYEYFSSDGSVKFHLQFDGTCDTGLQAELEALALAYDSIGVYNELQISVSIQKILLMLMIKGKENTKRQKQIPENLLLLIRYINNNYSKELSLDFLSSFSNYSKYHMCRLFKKYTGYSPNEYILKLRIDHAKDYLQTTSLPAKKIGALVGIQNTNYFYRMFKSHTGITPEEFRKRH